MALPVLAESVMDQLPFAPPYEGAAANTIVDFFSLVQYPNSNSSSKHFKRLQ